MTLCELVNVVNFARTCECECAHVFLFTLFSQISHIYRQNCGRTGGRGRPLEMFTTFTTFTPAGGQGWLMMTEKPRKPRKVGTLGTSENPEKSDHPYILFLYTPPPPPTPTFRGS
jgi:hypothetical protein